MKNFVFPSIIVFLFSSPVHASSCFCKIMCAWNGEDSSDLYKVIDVNCSDTPEKMKEFAIDLLIQHVKVNHPDYSSEELKSKTEIMCYESKVDNKRAQRKKSNEK